MNNNIHQKIPILLSNSRYPTFAVVIIAIAVFTVTAANFYRLSVLDKTKFICLKLSESNPTNKLLLQSTILKK